MSGLKNGCGQVELMIDVGGGGACSQVRSVQVKVSTRAILLAVTVAPSEKRKMSFEMLASLKSSEMNPS
jgi:ribosomal protein S9